MKCARSRLLLIVVVLSSAIIFPTTVLSATPAQNAIVQAKSPVDRSRNATADAASAQLDQARELATVGKLDEAIATFDKISSKYGMSTDPAVLTIVARAMYGKGSTVRHRGQNQESLSLFDRVIDRFGNASAVEQRRWVIWSLIQKGEVFADLSRSAEAISAYDDAIARAGSDAGLAKEAAVARYDKGMDLLREGQNDRAIAILSEIVSRYGDTASPELQEPVVLALDAKAIALEQAGKKAEAIAAYDAAVSGYGNSTDLTVRAAIVRTLIDKGITLAAAEDFQSALGVYDDVIRRFGGAKESSFQQSIATAHLNRGVALASLGRYPEARSSFDMVVQRFGNAPEPEIRELVTKAQAALRQLDQLGAAHGAVDPQPIAPAPTLEMAMSASPANLARSYLAMRYMLLATQMAAKGMTSITPEGSITKDNAAQWQKVFGARETIYRQAIEKRGVANFTGTYRLSSQSPSCAKIQSYFASMLSPQQSVGGRVTIIQSGFELKLKLGESSFDSPDGYATENTFAFSDPMNMDYVHLGVLNGDQLIIRPQPEVLHTWPAFAGPPKEEDIRSCSIVLTRERP